MIKLGKILTYKDLKNIPAGENQEALVNLSKIAPEIICRYEQKDMLKLLGPDILVRRGLVRRLQAVSRELKQLNCQYALKVVYGYRHPSIQKKYFLAIKSKLVKKYPSWSEDKLLAVVHNFIAVPEVAGHPVGGAIDITITRRGRELDLGTKIADFSDPEKIKTFSQKISLAAAANRRLLHDLMLKNGFAAFYGEWWHFSYGDKEWAAFYGRPRSLYTAISVPKEE